LSLAILDLEGWVRWNLERERHQSIVDIHFEARDDLRAGNERRDTPGSVRSCDRDGSSNGRVGSPSGDGFGEDAEGESLADRVVGGGCKAKDVVEDVFELRLVG
jgi:hypothetical protein